jgi:hypothetical protein
VFNFTKTLMGPDPAQVHYLVDSDFRTVAQGWARPDQTGPLDLWQARNPGYVIRTGDYAADVTAWNAARDLLVDFRGDVMFLTPGAYSVGASTWDVPFARILGQHQKSPKFGASPRVRNTSVNFTATQTLGADADGLEFGYIRVLATTAVASFTIALAVNDVYFHDFKWDSLGVATSASTIGFTFATTACSRWVLDQVTWEVDAVQGPLIASAIGLANFTVSNFANYCYATVGTYPISLLDINAGGEASEAIVLGPGIGVCGTTGAGTVSLLVESANLTGTTGAMVVEFYGDQAYCTSTTLVSSTADDWSIVESYIGATGPAAGVVYTS